ncbi:MAG: M28 family peptidase [bacterium]
MYKKTVLTILMIFALVLASHAAGNQPSRTALNSIKPSDVRTYIDFLASDSLKGRNTPSPGLNQAAAFIAEQFERLGLQPLNGDYYQTFHMNKVYLGKENYLKIIDAQNTEHNFKIKREFMPFEYTANKAVEGELVFAGYGITAPEYQYDDYANVQVEGKIVLVLRHEPGEKDSSSVFDGAKNSDFAKMQTKVENAIEHGAIGLIMVTDPVNHRSLRPRGFPWPSLYKNLPNQAIPYTLALMESKKIPVVHVGKAFVKQIFGSVDSLKSLQTKIDGAMRPNSFVISNLKAALKTTTDVQSEATQNVVALLEGSDAVLKKQAIVIGAHYDHVGTKLGKIKSGEDYIFNGADDNASGTVGLLEVAEAFTLAEPPQRSVIFIAFAGEEKGLFGSRFYVEKPLWPISKTKAMLNMDMIGRNAGDQVTIVGFSRSPDLNEINTEENKKIGLKLEYNGEQFFRRSDQYQFARKGIPVLFYNTGEHEDYHKVSDNPDKINEGKVAMIARLVFRTAWRAANTNQSFQYIEPN